MTVQKIYNVVWMNFKHGKIEERNATIFTVGWQRTHNYLEKKYINHKNFKYKIQFMDKNKFIQQAEFFMYHLT